MNSTEEYNATVAMNRVSNHSHHAQYGLHPGYTTAISVAITLLLVIIYLYYESAIQRVKTVCFRRRPTNNSTGDVAADTTKVVFHGVGDNGNPSDSIVPRNKGDSMKKKLLEEPGILCECGQIHVLRDCLKDDDLKPYKETMDKITSRLRSDTNTKCETLDETKHCRLNTVEGDLATVKKKHTTTATDNLEVVEEHGPLKPSEHFVQRTTLREHGESVLLPGSPTPPGDEKTINTGNTDSDASTPRCGTPLITIISTEDPSEAAIAYSRSSIEVADASAPIWHSGARPKEYKLKNAIS